MLTLGCIDELFDFWRGEGRKTGWFTRLIKEYVDRQLNKTWWPDPPPQTVLLYIEQQIVKYISDTIAYSSSLLTLYLRRRRLPLDRCMHRFASSIKLVRVRPWAWFNNLMRTCARASSTANLCR